jgi:sRNA-binding protein
MASQYRIERDRGTKESAQQFALLREKWPLAFPLKHQDIRPLAIGATGEIAAVMGWSLPYTLGVLHLWKMAPVYCQAVLCHDQRVALDGVPAEAVDTEAKDLAAQRLAQLAARKAAKKEMKTAAPARREADPCPRATHRDTARDAGAIARPGACRTLAPERVAIRDSTTPESRRRDRRPWIPRRATTDHHAPFKHPTKLVA